MFYIAVKLEVSTYEKNIYWGCTKENI